MTISDRDIEKAVKAIEEGDAWLEDDEVVKLEIAPGVRLTVTRRSRAWISKVARGILLLFAIAFSVAALLFIASAILSIPLLLFPSLFDDDAGTTTIVVMLLISTSAASLFAWVSATIWRRIIDPGSRSHA